jgi:hypothetical protein
MREGSMEKRYQVFVSSTYRDLIEERQEVIQALLELDCFEKLVEEQRDLGKMPNH